VSCGNFENLAQKLSVILATPLRLQVNLLRILERDAAAADVLARFVLEKSNGLQARLRCLDALDEKSPAKLTVEHWMIIEELATQGMLNDSDARNRVRDLVQRLDAKGRQDVLLRLAGGSASEAISTWFVTRYVNTKKLSDAAGGWGSILRRLGERAPADLTWLQQLADINDEAAAELAGLLREQGALPVDRAGHAPDWVPTPKYAELMIGLLDSPSQLVWSFALEALAKAPPKAEPDLLPAVERIALSPQSVKDVRTGAWRVLLRHLAARPDVAPRIAAFFRDAAKHGEFYELGIVAPLEASPVTERMELLRSILGLDLELADAEWLSNIFSTLPPEDAAPLYAGAVRLDTPAKRAMLVGVIDLGPLAKSSGGLEFLKGIALDASLSAQARYYAYASAGEAGNSWLDWMQLAEADDPIVALRDTPELADWVRQLPRAEQDRFLGALAKSRYPELRKKRLEVYPRDRTDYRQVLTDALEDPSECRSKTGCGGADLSGQGSG
jgi:hypothetical protein